MKEKTSKSLFRIADILEISWSFPRLGGILIGIGIGLFVAKGLEIKWGIISNDKMMFIILGIAMFCNMIGFLLASKKLNKNKEKSNEEDLLNPPTSGK